jgi:hypothetical protein|tara:strand:+ start:2409 stop:2591 length:183 start_codon:yes stop_codon:yes gene_type:complete
MSDISVSDASVATLVVELLSKRTEEGTPLFKENSITLEDGTVQILGVSANVQITVNQEEE